ncbi:MAG: hypothetical protein HFI92_07200 [Lachnospiraceae bacterium]|nr:hypothetical protein [Lachnospiraceae bacterium]
MNMKTIEGLVGARANIDLSDTAMGVYQQARQKGDTATAERALGYAGDMVNQAEAYEAKADEGMKADAKELEEKAKADQEKIIEKRKEDRKELEARIEQSRTPDSDTVEISGEGKAVSTETQAPESTEAAGTAADPAELPPVVYTSAGEVLSQEVTAEAELSVLA